MITTELLWHDYKYFPYERNLAHRELESITGLQAEENALGLSIKANAAQLERMSRLTYFKGIRQAKQIIIPDQARLEASALGLKNTHYIPQIKRQSTRYSAHGLHEYRGKFNPQIVRAIGNILGLAPGDWILDPFCGSGTTLLEAAHIGWNCTGIDINPMGVMVANAKVAAFKASPSVLQQEAEALSARIKREHSKQKNWKLKLPNAEYLSQWFAEPVLAKLAFILQAIKEGTSPKLQNVFRVVLSDICREVSLQDPGDLRIRRRKDAACDYPVNEIFTEALDTKIAFILKARTEINPPKSKQRAIQADIRHCSKRILSAAQPFDAAITSPPYVTALPYIDTQRLSLCLMGLIDSGEIRNTEKSLIGNREISDIERVNAELALFSNKGKLPDSVSAFCQSLHHKADHPGHGFRRKNVPALTYTYFSQMAEMFTSVQKLIQPRGQFALLVGANKTTLQNEEIVIDTPNLLGEVAQSRGWQVKESLSFETYQRFDVHKQNSIRHETLLILENNSEPASRR